MHRSDHTMEGEVAAVGMTRTGAITSDRHSLTGFWTDPAPVTMAAGESHLKLVVHIAKGLTNYLAVVWFLHF